MRSIDRTNQIFNKQKIDSTQTRQYQQVWHRDCISNNYEVYVSGT